MLRTARLLALTGAAASVIALAPPANASAQLICWEDRVIYTTDFTIHYRVPVICR